MQKNEVASQAFWQQYNVGTECVVDLRAANGLHKSMEWLPKHYIGPNGDV